MSKLRFTMKFCQEYVSKRHTGRMNVTNLKVNFKGKYGDLICAACRKLT